MFPFDKVILVVALCVLVAASSDPSHFLVALAGGVAGYGLRGLSVARSRRTAGVAASEPRASFFYERTWQSFGLHAGWNLALCALFALLYRLVSVLERDVFDAIVCFGPQGLRQRINALFA